MLSAISRKKKTCRTPQTALWFCPPARLVSSFLTLSAAITAAHSFEQLLPAIAGFFLFVLYLCDMSTSFPDGISFSELESLADKAVIREEEAAKEAEANKGPLL